MFANGAISPSSLSVKDLLWQVQWDKEKCTLCGRCTAVCPVQAIELGVHRKRSVQIPSLAEISRDHLVKRLHGLPGVRQKTDTAYSCIGCAL